MANVLGARLSNRAMASQSALMNGLMCAGWVYGFQRTRKMRTRAERKRQKDFNAIYTYVCIYAAGAKVPNSFYALDAQFTFLQNANGPNKVGGNKSLIFSHWVLICSRLLASAPFSSCIKIIKKVYFSLRL